MQFFFSMLIHQLHSILKLDKTHWVEFSLTIKSLNWMLSQNYISKSSEIITTFEKVLCNHYFPKLFVAVNYFLKT